MHVIYFSFLLASCSTLYTSLNGECDEGMIGLQVNE